MVVPYVAGGNADLWARTLAQKLGEAFKQPFVVENKMGANGGIAARPQQGPPLARRGAVAPASRRGPPAAVPERALAPGP